MRNTNVAQRWILFT